MKKNADRNSIHAWLVLSKAFQAMMRYSMEGIQESPLGDSDFRVLEALLHKGPLPVNTIGPMVFLTPGSISVAVDRLLKKGYVSREESPEDRRIRIVTLTPLGKSVIEPVYKEHASAIEEMLAPLTPAELKQLESLLKKAGHNADALLEARRSKTKR